MTSKRVASNSVLSNDTTLPLAFCHLFILWNIQQFKLFLPLSLNTRHHFFLIVSERDIFLVDIPVAGFQFLNQSALRHFPVPDQPVITYIIGQRCDEQVIFSEAAAHLIQFPQIGSQQRIRLRFRDAAGTSGSKTARFTGTVTENLQTGHADHRIGGIGPAQRTVQQGYLCAESHRNTKCFGNRCGLRQGAQTTGAKRRPAEERRARSGKIIDEHNPKDGVTGGPTLWKLTQGITAFAREQESERCRELHEISEQLMNRVKGN